MKDYIEERTLDIANYTIENKCTVRAAAKHFNISKSTINTVLFYSIFSL